MDSKTRKQPRTRIVLGGIALYHRMKFHSTSVRTLVSLSIFIPIFVWPKGPATFWREGGGEEGGAGVQRSLALNAFAVHSFGVAAKSSRKHTGLHANYH